MTQVVQKRPQNFILAIEQFALLLCWVGQLVGRKVRLFAGSQNASRGLERPNLIGRSSPDDQEKPLQMERFDGASFFYAL
jgi:hypothetical protein